MHHDDELGWHLRRVNAPLCGVETHQTGRTATREEGRSFKSPLRPEGSRCYVMIWWYLSAKEHKTNLAAGQTSWWSFSILCCAAWCHPVVFMMFLIIKKLSWPAHSIFGHWCNTGTTLSDTSEADSHRYTSFMQMSILQTRVNIPL